MKIRALGETTRLPRKGGVLLRGWERPTGKRLLTLFTLSLVLVACDTRPVGVDAPDAQFAKGEKPNKPGDPPKPPSAELIEFTGDLVGSQPVVGCCPNAGPFPEYMMTLKSPPFPAGISGPQEGNIFMNSWGRKGQGDYIVQFWWGAEPGDYFLEIKGGVKVEDRKTKETTVTFTDEIMTINPDSDSPGEVTVNFILTRKPAG